jgi:hypothetical protein
MNTHSPNQLGCYLFGRDQGFIRGAIERQVSLMDPAEGAQRGSKCRAGPLTGVAVPFTSAIAIIIPCPRMHAVADRGMVGMTPLVALPLIGIEPRAPGRKVFRDQGRAGVGVSMVAAPPALLPGLARDYTEDRRPSIGIGAVPPPLIGAPPGPIGGIAMGGAFFPPRCGTVRRLRRRCPPSQPSAPSP